MKRMVIAFYALSTLSLVHAAHNERKVYASTFEAMQDKGLLRQLPDGSWTADQPICNINSRTVGFTLTADGQWQPGGTTVTIDNNNSQEAVQQKMQYAQYMQQHNQMLGQGRRMQEDAEECRKLEQERRLAAQERIKAQQERDELARQRAAEAQKRENDRKKVSQSSSSSHSFANTPYNASTERRHIYVASNYVTQKNRIMEHEHDLRENEFCNASFLDGRTVAQVKAMYGIKD